MNNKIFWLIVIFILGISLAAAAFFYGAKQCPAVSSGQNNSSSTVGQTGNEGWQMTVSSIKQSDSFYNIWVEYPQFKGIDDGFSQKIADLMNQEVSDFKTGAKENWAAQNATAPSGQTAPQNPPEPFDFQASWTPTQLNDKYLSFVISIYYFAGGAHGTEEIYAFNYDISKKKEITILDFLGSNDALAKVAELSAQDIASQLESKGMTVDASVKQMIQDGTAPTLENFGDFNFNDNSLVIYFQRYQVAPGVAGSITVTLPKSLLEQNLIHPNY